MGVSKYESGFLAIVDAALGDPPTDDTFIRFNSSFKESLHHHRDDAFEEVDGRVYGLYAQGRGMRRPIDIIDALMWTAVVPPDLTEEEREIGYHTVDEFFDFLRKWRARYLRDFGR